MNERQGNVTTYNLRTNIIILGVFFMFMDGLLFLPQITSHSIPINYERAALISALGLGVGTILGGGLILFLLKPIPGSLIIPIKLWHLGFGILVAYLVLTEIPSRLAQSCLSLWEEAKRTGASTARALDCFANTWETWRFETAVVMGTLVGVYLWALIQEKRYKGQLTIELHSKTRWSIGGWLVTDMVMAAGLGFFLIYLFYRIFTLK